MAHRHPRSILITGASSGIGEALAELYAGPGMFLALTGRDAARLATVAERCRAKGAAVLAETFDVADRTAIASFVARADETVPLDLVIANAGISAGLKGLDALDAHVRAIFAVNVDGVLNTVHPAVACMAARGRGQIAVMSSLAGFRGMPGATAYAASKAAVRSYGEGLRGTLRPSGIRVSVICPGFVRSRMTARNRFPMPFLMDAERAARIIRRGLSRDRARIAFPWRLYVLARLFDLLPSAAVDRLTRRLPAKD